MKAPSAGFNHIPPKARVISVKLWRQYAYQRSISTGEDRAKQAAFKRASEHLLASGEVATWDDQVWIVPPTVFDRVEVFNQENNDD